MTSIAIVFSPKVFIGFIVGIVLIVGNFLRSRKKFKVWKTLTFKEKYRAVMGFIIGLMVIGIAITILIVFLTADIK